MTPTVYVALLTHWTGMGCVGLPADHAPLNGRPLHLSLHTSAEAADRAVMDALRTEWDRQEPYRGFGYSLGPSADWKPELLLAEAERQGYSATVHEQDVELSA